MSVDSQAFKDAMCQWASGVSVVCCKDNGGLVSGVTVSSFTSVSMQPPIVLVSLFNNSSQIDRIKQANACTISFLSSESEEASNYFANPKREPSKSLDFPTVNLPSGQVALSGLSTLDCSVNQIIEAGDHTLLLLNVLHAQCEPGSPLLYFNRGYRGCTD